MSKVSLQFEELNEATSNGAMYTDGCSGGKSDCCTRTCTRRDGTSDDGTLEDWDKYLEVNAGVLQY